MMILQIICLLIGIVEEIIVVRNETNFVMQNELRYPLFHVKSTCTINVSISLSGKLSHKPNWSIST